MIEAVNSSVLSASILRVDTIRLDATKATAAAAVPEASAPQAPQAPYISPYITVDFNYDKAVLLIRDSDTGDVEQQFPTANRLAQLKKSQVSQDAPVKKASVQEQRPPENAAPVKAAQNSTIVTVQDVTSSAPANVSLPSPQVAAAALSAGAQSGQSTAANVSVLA